MSVRIGWGFTRPKKRKPHELGGFALFKYTKTKDGRVRQIAVGALNYIRDDFERLRSKGQRLDSSVTGLARIAPDVSAELVAATVDKLHVTGVLWAPAEVKRVLT